MPKRTLEEQRDIWNICFGDLSKSFMLDNKMVTTEGKAEIRDKKIYVKIPALGTCIETNKLRQL